MKQIYLTLLNFYIEVLENFNLNRLKISKFNSFYYVSVVIIQSSSKINSIKITLEYSTRVLTTGLT